jgi:uncharacterized PurR-regulated membrane protein YhhQ (DUF165 family)
MRREGFVILTALYVAVVCSAQIGAQKIITIPWTHLNAPGGIYSVGVALALVELAHHTAPTRADGWRNAQIMVVCGFAASAILAGYIALIAHSKPAFPGQHFDELADTWRIVGASLAAFIVSETVDNVIGAPLRGRVHDSIRVIVSAAASAPLDSVVFLSIAFGSLAFVAGQIEAKYGATLLIGLPLVYAARRLVRA